MRLVGAVARRAPSREEGLKSRANCKARTRVNLGHVSRKVRLQPPHKMRGLGRGVGLGAVIPETQYAYGLECLLQAEHLALETSSTHHSHVVYDAAHRCGAATCLRGRGVPSMPSGAGGASVRLSAAGAVPCVHPCPVWGVTVIQRLDHRQQAAGPAYSKN
jgi:hypothetical protein